MNYLKQGKKTSEFYTSLSLLIFLFVINLFFSIENFYFYSVSIVIASYILSRSLFKNNRSSFVGEGIKSTEFLFYILGILFLIFGLILNKNEYKSFVISIAIVQVAYNISRGYAKGEAMKVNNKVQLIA